MSADEFDQPFDERERRILDNIDKFGCHINFVFDKETNEPDFAYSVGFPHSVWQGEVIVFGLSKVLMGSMINETLRQCREANLALSDWSPISGLLENFDVVARAVKPQNIAVEYFNSAMWHHVGRYGTPLASAFQLIWPSSNTGLFPWDMGCHQDVVNVQTSLYEGSLQ